MADKDDQDWFDMLSGRTPTDASPSTEEEIRALRNAMRAHEDSVPPLETDVEAGVHKLLFRLRQEKLSGVAPHRRTWQTWISLAAAASVAAVVGMIALHDPEQPDRPDAVRSGPDGAAMIRADDPEKLADEIADALRAIGYAPIVSKFGAVYAVEIDSPTNPDAQLDALLKKYKVVAPVGPRIRIEVLRN